MIELLLGGLLAMLAIIAWSLVDIAASLQHANKEDRMDRIWGRK